MAAEGNFSTAEHVFNSAKEQIGAAEGILATAKRVLSTAERQIGAAEGVIPKISCGQQYYEYIGNMKVYYTIYKRLIFYMLINA